MTVVYILKIKYKVYAKLELIFWIPTEISSSIVYQCSHVPVFSLAMILWIVYVLYRKTQFWCDNFFENHVVYQCDMLQGEKNVNPDFFGICSNEHFPKLIKCWCKVETIKWQALPLPRND